MRRNTIAINNVLKKKHYKTKLSITSILKNKSTNIILKNKKIKYKNYVEKHRSNPQYFKEKNYKAKILTRSIFKK
jgi:hypothetical protein